MGDWVSFSLNFKPRVVTEEFLTILDAGFAAGGYIPYSITRAGIGHSPPENRLDAVRAESLSLGYALPSHQGEPPYYARMWSHQSTCIVNLTITTLLRWSYFQNQDWTPDDSKEACQQIRDEKDMVAAGLKIFSALHEKTCSFYSEIRDDYNLIKTSGPATRHDSENFYLFKMANGNWLCPVCHEEFGTIPPWTVGTEPNQPSGEKCPSCRTHFGVDEFSISTWLHMGVWAELRNRWFASRHPVDQ